MADTPSELQFEIEKLERKHAEHPEGRFFVPLANAYRKMGDVETAEALLREGVQRHPDYLSAHIVLGRCLADRGATAEAEDEFRFVLSDDPQNLIALRTLGELALADGRPAEAADWYRELLAVDPMNEEARQALESLSDVPPSGELAAEFRSGAGWWEPEPESTPTDASILDAEPESASGAGGEAAFPADEELAGAEEIPLSPVSARPEDSGEGGYAEVPGLRVEPDQDIAEPSDEDDDGSSEVVTETIAELYARQGLHERAASVYQELIRRRGGDPTLEGRLAELERRIQAEPATTAEEVQEEEEEVPTPAAELDEDPFAASFADGFGSDRGDEIVAASTPPAPPSSRPTIAHFLTELAGWRPRSGGGVATEDLEPAPAVEAIEADLAAGFAHDEGASKVAGPEPGVSVGDAGVPVYEEPWAESEAAIAEEEGTASVIAEEEGTPSVVDAWAAPEEEGSTAVEDAETTPLPFLEEVSDETSDYGTGTAEEAPFPWELPGAAPGAGTELEPEDVEPPVDSFAAEEPASEREPLPAEYGSEAAPPPEQSEVSGPRPSSPSEGPSEDEDLESFQAWLRSLKR
jgi:tetratricopeptide (TPR) repeat protein